MNSNRIRTEQRLNDLKYLGQVPVGSLCCHAINRWCNNQDSYSFRSFIAALIKLLLSSLKLRKTRQIQGILFLQTNNSDRIMRMFDPFRNCKGSLTNNFTLSREFYQSICPIHVFIWMSDMLANFIYYKRKIDQILKESNSKSSRAQIYYAFTLQTLKYTVASKTLVKSEVRSILVDLDRAADASPVILAARLLKIKTGTLVHGSIFPPNLYVPVLANKVYCWGNIHRDYLRNFSSKDVKFIITGNTAYDRHIENNNIINEGRKNFVLTFVSANYSDLAQYKVVEFLGRINLPNYWSIRLRAHPAEDYVNLAIASKSNNLQVFDKSQTVEECINQTDLFIVIDSNFVFDALSFGKPTIFYASDSDHSDLPKLFEVYSNAVMIRNEIEMEKLLNRMKSLTAIYEESNYTELSLFYRQYCEDFGESAARKIYRDINAEKESY